MNRQYSFLSHIENLMLRIGYEGLSLYDLNVLISTVADKHGMKYSEVDDTYLLDHHKKIKVEVLSVLCDEAVEVGFTASNGHTYRATDKDQSNFIGKATELLLDTSITEILYRTEDMGYINHTREEFLQVYKEGVAHKETNLFKFNTLVKQVEEALTDSEIKAINWE